MDQKKDRFLNNKNSSTDNVEIVIIERGKKEEEAPLGGLLDVIST